MKQSVIFSEINTLKQEQTTQVSHISYLDQSIQINSLRIRAVIELMRKYWYIPFANLFMMSDERLGKEMARLDKIRVDNANKQLEEYNKNIEIAKELEEKDIEQEKDRILGGDEGSNEGKGTIVSANGKPISSDNIEVSGEQHSNDNENI